MIDNPPRRYLCRLKIAGRRGHVNLDDHPAGEVGRQCGKSADKINITTARLGPNLVGSAGRTGVIGTGGIGQRCLVQAYVF
jgi:hypothetical protein